VTTEFGQRGRVRIRQLCTALRTVALRPRGTLVPGDTLAFGKA
jgi:hypothetical protein